MHLFIVVVDNEVGKLERIASHDFTLVVDMVVTNKNAFVFSLAILIGKTKLSKEGAASFVKCQYVVGGVHVAVMVNPLRSNSFGMY